jgi:hypothetical protein
MIVREAIDHSIVWVGDNRKVEQKEYQINHSINMNI